MRSDASARVYRPIAVALTFALATSCFLPKDHETGTTGSGNEQPEYDVDALGVPRFVTTSYIDLAHVTRVSLFRSHDGHDYSDDVESCRSMKHYFKAPPAAATVYAPVTGTVRMTMEETTWGTQVQITSADLPSFTFVIFHVALASPLAAGDGVTAGQALGTHIGDQTYSDIAVEVNGPARQRRLVSYFDTLTDAAFEPYVARGITSRSQVIITREQRDANPLSCVNYQFTNPEADLYPVDVALF